MQNKTQILITNDDGIRAKGINSLISMLLPLGYDLVVIAPEEPQSAQSHAITIKNPIRVRLVSKADNVVVYACSGTPTDCIKFGLYKLAKNPQLVISGINHGLNISISSLYSGTLAAAMEGLLFNINSIALSVDDHSGDAKFAYTAPFVERIIKSLLNRPLDQEKYCLNVNFPKHSTHQIKGIKWGRQTQGDWKEEFVERRDMFDQPYYWLTGEFQNDEPTATDTDQWAINNNYVSIVPIQNDLTNHKQLHTPLDIEF